MITNKHMAMEVELIRWLLLIVAAVALILALATMLAAMPVEPRLLPPEAAAAAQPMAAAPARPFFPEAPPAREIPPAEAAARLWMVLEQQRAGLVAEALAGWEPLTLADEAAHWREIGMGAAYLQAGDFMNALPHLELAQQLAPNHPVAAYYMGILRLEQAAAVGRVPEPMDDGMLRMVGFGPRFERARFRVQAMRELRAAIAHADEIWLDERLLDTETTMEEFIVVPRAGDLLVALGAENFVGKAHHLLFGLHMDRGELIEAEMHLDMAAATGLATLYGYQDLADTYLAADRQADAARAARKDLRTNHAWVGGIHDRLATMANDAARAIWLW